MTRTTRWVSMLGAGAALALFTLPLAYSEAALDAEPAAPAAVAAAQGAACPANAKPANLGFTLKDMHGKDVNLAQFKGRIILLNFWATWCGPCKAEIPSFVELQRQYSKDLVILGLSVDDTAEKVKPYAAQYKINYPVLLGLGRDDFQDAYGPIWGIPTSFVIGRNGLVCKKHMGIASKDQIEKEIKALL